MIEVGKLAINPTQREEKTQKKKKRGCAGIGRDFSLTASSLIHHHPPPSPPPPPLRRRCRRRPMISSFLRVAREWSDLVGSYVHNDHCVLFGGMRKFFWLAAPGSFSLLQWLGLSLSKIPAYHLIDCMYITTYIGEERWCVAARVCATYVCIYVCRQTAQAGRETRQRQPGPDHHERSHASP